MRYFMYFFGKGLIVFTFLFWVFDRLTNIFSNLIGEMVCGDKYMCPVNGIVSDRTCGFNTDMHLSFILILLFVLGILLYVSSKKMEYTEQIQEV
jgi:hypothetical protein